MLASGHRCRMFAARAKKRFSRFVIRFCDFCDDLHHVAFASDLMQIALGKRDHLIGATNTGEDQEVGWPISDFLAFIFKND